MKPTLEKVQEYFKDAEIVRSLYGQEFTGLKNIHEFCGEWFCKDEHNRHRCIWQLGRYATILKTKTMKIEVTEETIKSYHNDACSEFKTRIEKDFPALFKPTLEVGKWYKSMEHNKFLMCFKKDANFSNYGFDAEGDWSNLLGMGYRDSLIPATDEEVSTALIAEANRRGFKKGVKFKHNKVSFPHLSNDIFKITSNNFEFKDGRMLCGGWDIFNNGLWAEIVKQNPVYEWQYVYYDSIYELYALSHFFYKSKKEFLKLMPSLKPLHKVKESKRIRE